MPPSGTHMMGLVLGFDDVIAHITHTIRFERERKVLKRWLNGPWRTGFGDSCIFGYQPRRPMNSISIRCSDPDPFFNSSLRHGRWRSGRAR